MKKLLALLVISVLALSLAACTTDNEDDEATVLKVGMDLKWPPFEDRDNEGNPYGISVALAYELGEYLERPIEIVDMDFANLIPALDTGQIDLILASMTIKPDRELVVDFSDPYFYYPLITVMNKSFADDNNIVTKADLFAADGVKFVGTAATISLTIPEAEANNPVIQSVIDTLTATNSLVGGSSDAFIISSSTAAAINNEYPETTVLLWDAVEYSPIGMAVADGDEDNLLDDINMFIAGMEENGVIARLSEAYDGDIAADIPGKGLEIYLGE